MNWDQVGPLVGVVVGAMLGGLAQVGADSLRGKREATQRARQERADATLELARAAWSTYAARSRGFGIVDMPHEWTYDFIAVLLDKMGELDAAVSVCVWLGPEDYAEAARSVERAIRSDDVGSDQWLRELYRRIEELFASGRRAMA